MIDKHVKIGTKVSHSGLWRSLLEEWLNIINEFVFHPEFVKDKEAPYWYGERALTGLLSASTWRLPNSWSLEEFTAERDNDKKTGAGRGDLWVGCGSESITIEAKVIWPGLDIEGAYKKTKEKLNEAKGQLKELAKEYQCGTPFSVCYVVPWPQDNIRALKEYKRLKILDSVADRFLMEGNCATAKYEFLESPPNDNEHIYPGVLLIAREEDIW